MNLIKHAIDLAGGPVAFTREINKRISKPVTYQAVLKWAKQGCLPRTDWTGETRYAQAIADALGGRVKAKDFLAKAARQCPAGAAGTAVTTEGVTHD